MLIIDFKYLLTSGSRLIRASEHITSTHHEDLIVTIYGIHYRVVHDEISSRSHILIKDIHKHFKTGFPSVVKLTNFHGDEMLCLICFYEIQPILPSNKFCCPRFPSISFSVCVFEKKYLDVRFALNSDENSPNFALGCFDVNSFIREFRRASSHEHSIPVLWKMLVDALRNIGYFDIYDYNDFQTTVFLLFQRMFFFPEHSPNLRELFYSFVQRILAKNAWFLIVDQSIHRIRRPSCELIELFSDCENPPIVHFINHDSNIVGLTKKYVVEMGYCGCCYALFTVSTNKLEIFHEPDYCWGVSQESNDILALLLLFPEHDPDCPPLTRKCYVDTSAIPQGFSSIGPLQLVLYKNKNSINVFGKRPDGTFERFSITLIILSEIFTVGSKFSQLTKYFASRISVEDLVEELIHCGFKQIFDGSATIQQICDFLLKSNFGYVLQKLSCEFKGFPERLREHVLLQYQEEVKKQEVETPTPVEDFFKAHIDSICEKYIIVDFNKIFKFLLEILENRDDLTPEIQEIVLFLKQLVEFLKPV